MGLKRRLALLAFLLLTPGMLSLGAGLATWLWPKPTRAATIRYVTNNGSGTACASTQRCTLATALGQAAVDDIISLASGTPSNPLIYQGAANMLTPPAGKSGTSDAHRITVQAEVEGGVLLDGQFLRAAVSFSGNSFWRVVGINAKNGIVTVIQLDNGSSDNIFQRIVAWDSDIGANGNVIAAHHNSNRNLFEDAAMFGTARKVFSPSQNGNQLTCRRCWIRWEGSTNYAGGGVTDHYTSQDFICDNCLLSYSGESMPQTYTSTFGSFPRTNFELHGPAAIKMQDGDPAGVGCKPVTWRGSIIWVRPTDRTLLPDSGLLAQHYRGISCVTVRDSIYAAHPSNSGFASLQPIQAHLAADVSGVSFTNVTTLGGVGNTFASNQVRTNLVASSSSSLTGGIPTVFTGTANPWTGTTGAQVCKRYINGTLTDEPLWPWPMNDRIKAATVLAGKYAGPCATDCRTGGVSWMSGSTPNLTPRPSRSETDVTAQIEAFFGTIPSQCRATSGSPFPEAVGYPANSAVVDGFTVDGPVNSATWTTITGSGLTISSGAAGSSSGFTFAVWTIPFAADQEAQLPIRNLPPANGSAFLSINFRVQDANNRLRASMYRENGTGWAILDSIAGGITTTLAGPINMGVDLATGDIFGVSATANAVDLNYYRAADPVWRHIVSTTAAPTPGGQIGIGTTAGGATVESFSAGNLSVLVPELTTSPASLTFNASQGGANPAARSFFITDAATTGTMTWTLADNQAWLTPTPSSGTGDAQGTASVNITGLAAGTYNGIITVTAPDSLVTTSEIPVTLIVAPTTVPSHGRGGRLR